MNQRQPKPPECRTENNPGEPCFPKRHGGLELCDSCKKEAHDRAKTNTQVRP